MYNFRLEFGIIGWIIQFVKKRKKRLEVGFFGAGAIVGVNFWLAAAMAGIGGVATVLERLARSYLEDGILTKDEIDSAFTNLDTEKTIKNVKNLNK